MTQYDPTPLQPLQFLVAMVMHQPSSTLGHSLATRCHSWKKNSFLTKGGFLAKSWDLVGITDKLPINQTINYPLRIPQTRQFLFQPLAWKQVVKGSSVHPPPIRLPMRGKPWQTANPSNLRQPPCSTKTHGCLFILSSSLPMEDPEARVIES